MPARPPARRSAHRLPACGRSWRGRRRRASARADWKSAIVRLSASSERTTSASWSTPPLSRTAAAPGRRRDRRAEALQHTGDRIAVLGARRARSRASGARSRPSARPACRAATILPVVDDPDAVGEHVRLLEVLRGEEDGHAVLAREPRDLLPTGRRGSAGPGRWSARRGTGSAGGGRARAPGRAGASCRPSSRRPCGRPRPSGPTRSSSASPRGRRSAFGMPWSVVCRRMCSRPVSSGSSAASCSAAPIAVRTAGPSRTMSWPATRAVPARGRQQGGEHQHRGRLAGAVRPEEAVDLAGLDASDRCRPPRAGRP